MVVVVSPWTRTQSGRHSRRTPRMPSRTLLVISVRSCPGFIRFRSKFGPDLEKVKDLVKHLPVLGGRQGANFGPWLFVQGKDDGGHLDGLGAGTDDAENFFSVHVTSDSFGSITWENQ